MRVDDDLTKVTIESAHVASSDCGSTTVAWPGFGLSSRSIMFQIAANLFRMLIERFRIVCQGCQRFEQLHVFANSEDCLVFFPPNPMDSFLICRARFRTSSGGYCTFLTLQ